MKKSMLALAVLGMFAGAASAQSSVTMYGKLDLGVGKPVGSPDKGMFENAGSRLGMRGVEDLGGGLKALFHIEHRFNADNGVNTNVATNNNVTPSTTTTRMWQGISIVGLEGGFGRISLGRNYTPAFLMGQLQGDPWGWDTVTARQHSGITGGGIAPVRNDSSLTYNLNAGGFALGAQIAEAKDAFDSTPKRPISLAMRYAAGPISFGLHHEVPGQTNAKWTGADFGWKFGTVTPRLFIGSGTNAANQKVKGQLLSVAAGIGAGELRAAVGNRKVAGATNISSVGLGYHHNLSKRTKFYMDVARDSKVATDKVGYDVGIQHNF